MQPPSYVRAVTEASACVDGLFVNQLCCDNKRRYARFEGSGAMTGTDVAAREAAMAQIVETLRAHRDEIVETGVERIFEAIPAYGKLRDSRFKDDVRTHVGVHQDLIVRSVADGRPPGAEDLEFMRPVATRRVGRIPLADFMHAFRTYHEVFWEEVLEIANDEDSRIAALDIAGTVMRYINAAASQAAEAYLDAERLALAHGDRVRRDLLDDLLAGRPPAPGPKLMAARDAGLNVPVPCVVIVAVPLVPPDDEHTLRAVALSLARAIGSSLRPLTVTRHDELVLIARVEREIDDLVGDLRAAQERLAGEGATLAIGMSSVQAGLERTSHAYAEAEAALERVRGAGGVVALPVLSAFDCLTLFGRETARGRIPANIRQFVAEDMADGRVLTSTLLEYVASDFNAKLTAERLFVHPNTARYRLGKIEERTGCNLRRVTDVLDLLIAVRVAEAELVAG
jgi:PucR C-terminal helix-turn-helix domain/GGDEF-like domain